MVGTMGIGGPQGLTQWALSPGQELSARLHPLLLGCCGQDMPARGTVQKKGKGAEESIKTVACPSCTLLGSAGISPPWPRPCAMSAWVCTPLEAR